MRMCIVGYGSIGERHADNLKTLGHTVSVLDTSEEARNRSVSSGYCTYSSLQEALETLPEIVLICTDTTSHIPLCQEVLIHNSTTLKGIFIEKPISFSMEGVETVVNICKERNIKLGCACNLLYLSGIKLMKMLLNNNSVGTVYSASYFFGHNLSKWNNRDYRNTYSAGEKGGIILDDIHSIYLCEDMFGHLITDVKASLHYSKLLEITNEDAFELIGKTNRNILLRIHGDYLASEYTRNLEIQGTEGTLQWEMCKVDNDMLESYVYIKTPAFPEYRTFNVSQELNCMYMDMMADYIKFVNKEKEYFHNGVYELIIVSKIKEQQNNVNR